MTSPKVYFLSTWPVNKQSKTECLEEEDFAEDSVDQIWSIKWKPAVKEMKLNPKLFELEVKYEASSMPICNSTAHR